MKKQTEKRKLLNLTLLEVLIALVPIVFYLLIFNSLPDTVPTHYGANNIPNRWVLKVSFSMILICALGFLGMISGKALTWFCSQMNAKQSSKQIIRKVMAADELFMTAFFSFLSVYFLVVILGQVKLSSGFILRVSFAGLSILWIAIGNYLPKIQENDKSGIRTNSTLKGKNVWFKGLRFGGKVVIICGILGLLLASCYWIPNGIANSMIIALYGIMLVIIIIYSAIRGAEKSSK